MRRCVTPPGRRGGTAGELGALVHGFDGTRFSLRPDADGDLWDPAWPVCLVDWYGADAFGTWEAERTGQPWQLPGELAWEKAARGVDGRFHPWGDGCDPSWASMRASQRGRIGPTAVGAFPVDESPYGIRDLAGSMQDWCRERFFEHGPPIASARNDGLWRGPLTPGTVLPSTKPDGLESDSAASTRVVRGGSWSFSPSHTRVANRVWDAPSSRRSILGFRLARPYA